MPDTAASPAPLPVSTVLFDLGDTLLYFDGDWEQVFRRSRQALFANLQQAGLALDDGFMDDFYQRMQAYYRQRETEFIEYTVGYVLSSALQAAGRPQATPQVVTQAVADMHRVTQAHWLPEVDALPTLQRLQQQGYRLGLISNAADDANTQLLIDKGGFRPYFEVIISSAAHGLRKPNPRIFQSALDVLQILPHQAVMVGDTLGADVLGAHNAGIYAIWIDRRAASRPANLAHQDTIIPDRVIHTLSELPDVLTLI